MPVPDAGLRSPLRLRLGLDIDTFRSVNLENDPGAIGDAEFQRLNNARILANGKVVPRGGQSKVNTNQMEGCVSGLVDDEFDSASVVIIPTGLGDLTSDPDPIYAFNPDTGEVVAIVSLTPDGRIWGAAILNGYFYATIETQLDSAGIELWRGEREALLVEDAGLTRVAELDEGGTPWATNPIEHDGSVWVGWSETQGDFWKFARIEYDSAIAVEDDSLAAYDGNNGISIAGVDHNGRLFAAGKAGTALTPGILRWRNDSGAWASVNFPAAAHDPVMFNYVIFQDATYMFGYYKDSVSTNRVGAIFKWDGTSVTIAHALTPIAAADTQIGRGRVVFGIMYYLLGESGETLIGRTLDGSTWDDSFHDLGTEFGAINGDGFGEMQITRNNLYVIVNHSGGDAGIYQSAEDDMTDWTLVTTVPGGLHATRPPSTQDMNF